MTIKQNSVLLYAATLVSTPLAAQSPSHGVEGVAYQNYAPYPCLAGAFRMDAKDAGIRRLTWRDRWPDTTTTANAPDSLLIDVDKRRMIGELRKCLAPHTLSTTPIRHLLGLGLAWLIAEDDGQAEAAFHAVIKAHAQKSVDERALLFNQLVEAYLDGKPHHLPIALAYLTQLDALGTPVAGRRLAMHNRVYTMAQALDSVSLMIQQTEAARKINEELKGDALLEWEHAVVSFRLNQADLEARRGNFSAAVKLLEAAGEELGAIDPKFRFAFAQELAWKYSVYGKPAKPIVSTFVAVPGKSEFLKTLPLSKPGRVSLRVFVSKDNLQNMIPLAGTVQRIVRQFGSKIDVILFAETLGFHAGRLIENPEDEGTLTADFIYRYLQIPAPMVIHAGTVAGKFPDGRLIREPDPNGMPNATLVLIDAQGNVRNIDNGGEVRLKNLIKEMTAATPST